MATDGRQITRPNGQENKMNYRYSRADLKSALHDDGTVWLVSMGKTYNTELAAQIDNFQGRAVYLAELVDAEGDSAGLVVWEIISPDCDDGADACNWDKFDVYFNDVQSK